MPSTNVRSSNDVNKNTLHEIRDILGKVYSNISLRSDDTLTKPFAIKRTEGGGYEIQYNPKKIGATDPDAISLKIISSIETLESLAKIKLDTENVGEYTKYLKNSSAGAIKFFYSFLFGFLSIHKNHISPSYAKRLEDMLHKQALKLARKYSPVPKHIEFLLAVVGIEAQDEEVREAIENIKQAGVLNVIFDSRQSDGEKLKNIHANILPLYKYFLGYDKYQYKPEKKVKDRVDETKGKVDEITGQPPEAPQTGDEASQDTEQEAQEEHQNPGDQQPPEQNPGGEEEPNSDEEAGGQGNPGGTGEQENTENESGGAQSQEPQGFPDYQDTYQTPEGGKFEKDPNGTGFKIEIHPGLLGYYVNDHKSFFNRNTLEWTNKSALHSFTQTPRVQGNKYTLEAFYDGDKLKAIPIPYSYTLDIGSLQYVGDKPNLYRDENGAFYLKIAKKSQVTIDFYKEDGFVVPRPIQEDGEKIYSGKLSPKGEQAMVDTMNLGNTLDRVRHIREYVQKNHFYPAGKNSKETMDSALKIQSELKKHSNAANYIANLDNSPHLECYSANTLFVAMLRNIGVECRIVTGFHVQNFNKNGDSELTSSNGHGWCEVWNGNEWIRFDATPGKDPNDPANKPDPNDPDADKKEENKPENNEQADDGGEDSEGGEGGGESSEGESSEGKGEQGGQGNPSEGEGDPSGEGGESDGDANTQENEGGEGKPSGDESKDGPGKPPQKEGKKDSAPGDTGNTGDSGDKDTPDSDAEGTGEGSGGDSSEYDRISEETPLEEEDANFDPEEAFKKMYEELEEDTSVLPDENTVDTASEQIGEEEMSAQEEDEDERSMRNKYPELSQEQIKEMGKFLKDFRKELSKISKIKNPGFVDATSENETLEDELRSIMDRVISRSIKESEFPRYPVDDGYNLELIDPVQLYLDSEEGRSESYSFKTTETREEEELKIVKIRRRKILDGSGSMGPEYGGGAKLRIQQQIEVLENKVTAEKQRELDELSNELDRDLRLETETWQFGGGSPYAIGDFAVLKPMSSDFHELEQATVWKLAEKVGGGTNDYDPLESIQQILLDEHTKESKETSDNTTTLERIRAGFLVRELNAHKELESKGADISPEERVHLSNLNVSKPEEVFRLLLQFLIHTKVEQSEVEQLRRMTAANAAAEYKTWIQRYGKNLILGQEELEYFSNLDISSVHLAEVFDGWLQALKEKDQKIEPILEIIEVSSDGGSADTRRLQRVVSKLRGLGAIVIAYGLGDDGKAVETVYENAFNPAEGGYFCRNLLDYPRKKAKAWHNILDKI